MTATLAKTAICNREQLWFTEQRQNPAKPTLHCHTQLLQLLADSYLGLFFDCFKHSWKQLRFFQSSNIFSSSFGKFMFSGTCWTILSQQLPSREKKIHIEQSKKKNTSQAQFTVSQIHITKPHLSFLKSFDRRAQKFSERKRILYSFSHSRDFFVMLFFFSIENEGQHIFWLQVWCFFL